MGVTATFVIAFADDLLRRRSLGRKYVRTQPLHVFLLHRIECSGKPIERAPSFAEVAVSPHRFQTRTTLRDADRSHHHAAALQVVGPITEFIGLLQCKCIAQLCKCLPGFGQIVAAKLHQFGGPRSRRLSQPLKYIGGYRVVSHEFCVAAHAAKVAP